MRKFKYLDKDILTKINHISDTVMHFNRTLPQDVIDALPEDKLFPITFVMAHEHKAGKPCEPHVRCIIAVPALNETKTRTQLILDMDMALYDVLPEVEIPDTTDPEPNQTPEPAVV